MDDYYVITKTAPGDIYLSVSPISNTGLSRIIVLDEKRPSARLPKDWALGIFLDPGTFSIFEKGYFTFDKLDEIVQLAIAEKVYFGEELAFEPGKVDYTEEILTVLKGGKRTEILALIENYKTPDKMKILLSIAGEYSGDLSTSVVSLLEKELNTQIQIDEE